MILGNFILERIEILPGSGDETGSSCVLFVDKILSRVEGERR